MEETFMGGVGAALQKTWDVVVKGEHPEAPTMPAPPPSMSDTAEKAKNDASAETAANAERKNRGRASTVLTGASGVSEKATTSRRTLLGE
jgi:hypothetical protein